MNILDCRVAIMTLGDLGHHIFCNRTDARLEFRNSVGMSWKSEGEYPFNIHSRLIVMTDGIARQWHHLLRSSFWDTNLHEGNHTGRQHPMPLYRHLSDHRK